MPKMPTPRNEDWTFGQAFVLYVVGCVIIIAVILIGRAAGWWW